MKQKLLYYFLLFTSFVIQSQTPCTNGFAGAYPCSNYGLQANVPVSTLANTMGTPEGSDVWGWTDGTTGKEYALAAMTNSTAFVDVSDPQNPVFLGRLDTENGITSLWRDVKIYNDYAFIVADNAGNHGMQVFDLSRLRGITTPQNFTADTVFNGVGSCHNIVINETSAIAYLVGCNNFSGGPNFIDISDPLNPVSLGGYSSEGYTHDAQVITYNGPDTEHVGKEIFIGSNASKVVVLDVTNKNNVTKISDMVYPFLGYTHQGWFTEDHRYFLLGDETDELNFGLDTRTLIFDLQDLDNPVLSSTYEGSSKAIDHNGYVKGNEFFMASYRAGMRVFDISNIGATSNAMTEIGFFDTYPANNSTTFDGAWSIYPYFASGNILINDIQRGLFVVKKNSSLSTPDIDAKISFTLSPNPSNSVTKVTISDSKTIQSIVVFNILGKRVFLKENINRNEYNLPTDKMPAGIYLIKINNLHTKKLIVR